MEDYVTRGEFGELGNSVTALRGDVALITTRLNSMDGKVEQTIRDSIREEYDRQIAKTKEYILSEINDKFEKEDYERLKKKEAEGKDLKTHAKKTVVQYVALGICGAVIAAYMFVQAVTNTELQNLVNNYGSQIEDMQDRLNQKGE